MSITNHVKVLAIVFLLASGCRTYGGYDSKELNVDALAQITEQVTTSASMAESELSLLVQASSQDPSLSGFADEFAMFLERHKELATRLSAPDSPKSYRSTSRAIGATVSEMNIVARGYEEVKMATAEHRGIQVEPMRNVKSDITYEVVPPYFRRIDLRQSLSMRDVLN